MSRLIRWPALMMAYVFLVLAVIGIVLPGLPTVPFLLLAAWFAARGSQRLHRWLYTHPRFGAMLIDWEQQGAISRRSKRVAVALLTLSWFVMYWRIDNDWLLTALALLFVVLAIFLLTRPEPR
ncbi:MAG: YbaN family protein [Thiohalomonadaceae bacterium]